MAALAVQASKQTSELAFATAASGCWFAASWSWIAAGWNVAAASTFAMEHASRSAGGGSDGHESHCQCN
jgi:hypothetical protein